MPEISDPVTHADSPGSPSSTAPRRQTGYFASNQAAIVFGVIGPLICFGLKPIVLDDWLQSELLGLRSINLFWVFCYGFVGLEIATLALWLWRGDRLRGLAGGVAGVLTSGAIFAGGLGLVLLPFSLIGIAVNGIGLLGLMPLFTALTYFAHARRAASRARVALGARRATLLALLSALLVLGVPAAFQAQFSRLTRQAIEDVARGDLSATARLTRWYAYVHPDRLVWAYEAERDEQRRKGLASAYYILTGGDIERRISQLDD
jgi:hypothetical protein